MGTVADEWRWLEYVSVIALWVFIACGLGLALAPMARAIVRGQRLIMEEPTPEGRDHPQERPEPLAIEAAAYDLVDWDRPVTDEQVDRVVETLGHGRFRVPPYVPQPVGEDPMETTSPLHISKWASSGDKTQPPRKVW